MVRVESRLQIPKNFSPHPPPTLSMATLPSASAWGLLPALNLSLERSSLGVQHLQGVEPPMRPWHMGLTAQPETLDSRSRPPTSLWGSSPAKVLAWSNQFQKTSNVFLLYGCVPSYSRKSGLVRVRMLVSAWGVTKCVHSFTFGRGLAQVGTLSPETFWHTYFLKWYSELTYLL